MITQATTQSIFATYDDGTYFATMQLAGTDFTYAGTPQNANILGDDLIDGTINLVVVTFYNSPGGGSPVAQFFADEQALNVPDFYTPGGALNSLGTVFNVALQTSASAAMEHPKQGYTPDNILFSNNPPVERQETKGNDLWVAETADYMRGGGGDDILKTSASDATIFGGWGDDFIAIEGEGSGAKLAGNGGNDHIVGGLYDDRLIGGFGNDVLTGNGGADYMIGGDGNDIVIGGDGDDTVRGDDGHDFLNGGDGDNRLYGGDGVDSLLSSGEGRDTMFGGDGADTFIIDIGEDGDGDPSNALATEFALIRDFDLAEDKLQFSNAQAALDFHLTSEMFYAHATNVGSHVIYDDGEARIKILNVQLEEFDGSNFFGLTDPMLVG